MKKAIIISGNLAQDHEFIYPFYRLLEEDLEVDVCLLEGKPVKGFLGTDLPPNKNHKVKKIEEVNPNDYEILVLPGGVKAMEKVRQNLKIIKFISDFDAQNKIIACICSGAQLLISAMAEVVSPSLYIERALKKISLSISVRVFIFAVKLITSLWLSFKKLSIIVE